MDAGLTGLVVALSAAQGRERAAAALAAAVGAERLVMLVRDPAIGVLVPAPGFPQTLPGGPAWRAMLARAQAPGRHAGEVDLPAGTASPALALAEAGAVAVFVGGRPAPATLEEVARLLPLLAGALRAEQEAFVARAEARESARAAGRAEALAQALEASRAEQAKLNAELRAEHRRKDEFLAMLAHELRNPLAPLVNAIELMRRVGADATARERSLEIAGRQANQLARLVDDLLDVSRVSHGRVELRRRAVALDDTLAEAVESVRAIVAARGHRLVAAPASEPLVVFADAARLTQVFSNLLHNAAKYTDPGGCIEIAAAAEGGHAVVRVRDNGIGIDADMLDKVFNLFTQAPASGARAHGGLGIGLTLVRSLVELHGGEVSAESAGAGKGSTFVVRLPRAGAAQGAGRVHEARGGPVAAAPLAILVVDDNHDAADTLAEMLRIGAHQVHVSYSSAEALQIAADLRPDLVILDLGMPEFDGFELARRMRRMLPAQAHLVALSGYGAEADRRRAREAGFDEHLLKPVLYEKLEAIVNGVATRRGVPPAAVA